MVFFTFLGNLAKAAVETTTKVAGAVVEVATSAVGAVVDTVGGLAEAAVETAFSWIAAPMVPIIQRHMEEVVLSSMKANIAVISWREELQKKAATSEETCINGVMKGYDNLIRFMEEKSADQYMLDLLRMRREETAQELRGVFTDYVQQKISDVNEDFMSSMSFSDAAQRNQAIEQKTQRILREAHREFKRQTQVSMKKLNADLSQRLMGELNETENQLNKRKAEYETLSAKVNAGTLNIENLWQERIPLCESAWCAERILDVPETICASRQCAECEAE